jgi:hypothetical protein
MTKSIVTLVLTGALVLAVAPSAVASEPRHNMDFNTGLGIAQDRALAECNVDPNCFAFGADPCRKLSRHKMICTLHNILGTPGNQAAQTDCHRDLGMRLRRRSFRISTNYLGPWLCSPNTQHPGFRGLEAN